MWSQNEATKFCIWLESFTPSYGCHVALTGGTLYKPGDRKDLDILLYRIRQIPEIDIDGLTKALIRFGLIMIEDCGWVLKAQYEGKNIDFFFPERPQMAEKSDGWYI